MKLVKNRRPYYAKWWFFISLVSLGWITPITKNWYLFLHGESIIASSVNVYGKSAERFYTYIFHLNGHKYIGSNALTLSEKIPKKSIKIYYDKKNPNNNITLNLNTMYKSHNLYFPLGLQIGLSVFFLLARFDETNS